MIFGNLSASASFFKHEKTNLFHLQFGFLFYVIGWLKFLAEGKRTDSSLSLNSCSIRALRKADHRKVCYFLRDSHSHLWSGAVYGLIGFSERFAFYPFSVAEPKVIQPFTFQRSVVDALGSGAIIEYLPIGYASRVCDPLRQILYNYNLINEEKHWDFRRWSSGLNICHQKCRRFEFQIHRSLYWWTAIRCRPTGYHTWPIGALFDSIPLQVSGSPRVVGLDGFGACSFHYTHTLGIS